VYLVKTPEYSSDVMLNIIIGPNLCILTIGLLSETQNCAQILVKKTLPKLDPNDMINGLEDFGYQI